MFDDIKPGQAPLVTVEWVDITSAGAPGLTRRWTDGRLLSLDYESEGVVCVVIGNTWDEDGWSDYSTFPATCVLNIEDLREAADHASAGETDS